MQLASSRGWRSKTRPKKAISPPIRSVCFSPLLSYHAAPRSIPRKTRDAMRARGHGEARGGGEGTVHDAPMHARTPTPRPAAAWRGQATGRRRKGTKEAVTAMSLAFVTKPSRDASRQAGSHKTTQGIL